MMIASARPERRINWAVSLDRFKTPFVGAVGASVVAIIGPRFFATAVSCNWDVEAIYSSTLNMFAIITGVLFTFYGIVVSSENDFMRKLRIGKSTAYAIFRRDLRAAIRMGALVTIGSIPFIITRPAPLGVFSVAGVSVTIWAGMVAAGLCLFWRVASIFFLMVDDVPNRPPAA